MPSTSKPLMRERVWEILESRRPRDPVSRTFDLLMGSLILLNVLAVVLDSVETIGERFGPLFDTFQALSIAAFSMEYAARVWSCVTQPEYSAPFRGRLRYALTPLAVVDLIAILPFFVPFGATDLRVLRVARLFRLLQVARLGRYSEAVRLFGRVLRDRKEELAVTGAVMALLLTISSSLIYFAEADSQPDRFRDIPSAMWWSVITLTSVGYGDVVPVTPLGRLLGGVIALLGVGTVAALTGILGAGFVEELQNRRRGPSVCPHCGGRLEGR